MAPVYVKRALAAAATRASVKPATDLVTTRPPETLRARVGRRPAAGAWRPASTSPDAGSGGVDLSRAAAAAAALPRRRAGVGKTEVAKVLAAALGTELIRLQCYEGLDVSHAVYEWNYPRQILEIRLLEALAHARSRRRRSASCSPRPFLIKRPLLRAIEQTRERPPVLLIDEIDRADEEFEGYLLELLSDFQVTIPELGTIRAREAAGRDHHVEPDARSARRAQAPLCLHLDRLPGLRQGAPHRRGQGAGRVGAAGRSR